MFYEGHVGSPSHLALIMSYNGLAKRRPCMTTRQYRFCFRKVEDHGVACEPMDSPCVDFGHWGLGHQNCMARRKPTSSRSLTTANAVRHAPIISLVE